jgi:ribosomal protein S18 acetylase RimI-like enzyme
VSAISIRALERQDAARAADVLARAFMTSPTYQAIFAGASDERRLELLRRVKRGFVESSLRHHAPRALFAGDALAACMLVMRPAELPISWSSEAWQSMGCATTGPRAIIRFLRLRAHFAKKHEPHMKEPHFYLFVLGVDPLHQRRGYGRELLRVLHEDADAQGAASYLETDTDANVRLYESVGYRIESDERIASIDDLRVITMKRPPRDPSKATSFGELAI